MARTTDKDRILDLLKGAIALSNAHIKNELTLNDDRYAIVRTELLKEDLVSLYRCRGGGICITKRGERESDLEPIYESSVDKEKDLYAPLCEYLRASTEESEVPVVVCNTSSLKKPGKWQNPDVAEISIEVYEHLHQARVAVTSYEVKQFCRWDVSVVFEAAAHDRFVHRSYVVLEWPRGLEFSLSDSRYRLDQVARECRRFGVGLKTLHKHYTSHRLYDRIDAVPRSPAEADLDEWLQYVFSRQENRKKEFKHAWQQARRTLDKDKRGG